MITFTQLIILAFTGVSLSTAKPCGGGPPPPPPPQHPNHPTPHYPTITQAPGDSCSSTSVCADYIKTCTEGGVSTEIWYGGCFADCKPWPTFTPPPCPTPTASQECSATAPSVCVDSITTCGTGAVLTYGGCFPDCQPWPTFTPPPCPTTTF